MKKIILLPVVFLLFLLAAGCGEAPMVQKTNYQMDTIVTITLYDWQDASSIDRAFKEIDRLENLLSVEREGSDLYRLAEAAGKEWVEISPETEEILTLAKEYSALSEGCFDITAGPLIDLWGIRNGEGHYPSEEELAAVLPLIRSDDLLVEKGRAFLRREGMKANLGAIAKGYIADKVKALLLAEGVEHALLDLGRNILLIGGKSEQANFCIGVQDPDKEKGEVVTLLSASDLSIVTSGIYERYFTFEGQKYHHILNPFTGFPADNGLSSVTILSETSVQGDALSTTCLLLGAEKGLALVESLKNVEALFLMEDGSSLSSSGFSDYVIS